MRLIFWMLAATSTIPVMCPTILSWYFSPCLVPTTCCSSLHFWTIFGQDFLARFFCLRRPQHGHDCGIAISLDKNLSALEQLCKTSRTLRQESMMQTDAWKSQCGLPSNHSFVQYDQWPCYSFFLKISAATIKTVQLLIGRFKSCGNFRVSMMLGEERLFYAAFLSQSFVALWDF